MLMFYATSDSRLVTTIKAQRQQKAQSRIVSERHRMLDLAFTYIHVFFSLFTILAVREQLSSMEYCFHREIMAKNTA
jgi:hypothetical protein